MNYHNHELNVKFVQQHQAQRQHEAQQVRLANVLKAEAASTTLQTATDGPIYGAALARIGAWMQHAGERLQARYSDLNLEGQMAHHGTSS